MLTHVLRHNFFSDWALNWLRPLLPNRPSAISVDERGDLILEWNEGQENEQVWSPAYIVKQLQKSEPDATTVCCCWFLCRQYDDCQDTSDAVTAAVAARLSAQLGVARWYWDAHGALVSVTPVEGDAAPTADIKLKQGKEATRFVLLPSGWLRDVLVKHLRDRAFRHYNGDSSGISTEI